MLLLHGLFWALVFSIVDSAASLNHVTLDPSDDDIHQRVIQDQLDQSKGVIGHSSRPFYAIAHRVLDVKGVRAAVRDGANAIEIDVYAWSAGWYADHDGTPFSRGDMAWQVFEEIQKQRQKGNVIAFVWLDIKNPDYCKAGHPKCSIERLQQLARGWLDPVGVRVLYGFYNVKRSRAFNYLRGSLQASEAINLDGDIPSARDDFERHPPINLPQRVYSRGYFFPTVGFGGIKRCDEATGICPDLKRARESGNFGKIFGWTISSTQMIVLPSLIYIADVDGLIYGYQMTSYSESSELREVLKTIRIFLAQHPSRHYARQEDNPW